MLEQRIRQIMADIFGLAPAAIGDDASRETLEQWDSMGHMNLCLALEEEFRIALDGERVAHMATFRDVLGAVAAAQA